MIKVVVACGSGMGSSQMIKMKVEKVLKKMGVEATLHHTNIGEAKTTAHDYNVIICPENLGSTFDSVKDKVTVITLKNLLSEKEIEEKLTAANVASMK